MKGSKMQASSKGEVEAVQGRSVINIWVRVKPKLIQNENLKMGGGHSHIDKKL